MVIDTTSLPQGYFAPCGRAHYSSRRPKSHRHLEISMLRQTLLAVAVVASRAASNQGPKSAEAAEKTASASASAKTDRPLLIAAEDLLTVRTNALASGPVITGSVQPERRADLRAEVSSVVLQVLKENG